MALMARVQGMLFRPRQEWQVIDKEATTPAQLYRDYVVPLAIVANAPLAIGTILFSPGVGIGTSLAQAVVGFALSLAIVYVAAVVIDQLAPRFGGTRSMSQALKVAGYGFTAAFIAGIFSIVPALSILGILGLYSLYQIYTGLPVLMKTPPDRAFGYVTVLVVVLFVVTLVLSAAYAAVFPPA